MKTHNSSRWSWRPVAVAVMMAAGAMSLMAQSSLPAPGSGGSFNPAPSGGPGPGGPGPGMMGGPGGPMGWGSSWGWGVGYPGPNGPLVNGPGWQNSGVVTVIGCGYDVYGTWRNIPLRVSYRYNGIDYDVTVLSAWNPWSDIWNKGIDMPAYSTSYYTHGNTYDYYVVLASGTYYFNL